MKIHLSKIELPDFGALKVNIPVISLGQGNPKISIIAGIHGNERTGLLIMKKLITNLKLKKGQVDFIPCANPISQALYLRDLPNMLDTYTNLNRNFPGKENDEFGLLNAKKLTDAVINSNLIIDLHTFSLPCPVVGILVDGPQKTFNQSKEFIKMICPDIIWRVNTEKKHEQEFTGTLGYYLHQKEKNFIGIELPKIYRIKEEQINQIIKGIYRVLKHLDMTEEKMPEVKKPIPIYDRFPYVRSLKSGLFTSTKKLFDLVKSGDQVGEIFNLYDFSIEPVISPYDGTLIILLDQDFVRTGDKLFSVAQEINLF